MKKITILTSILFIAALGFVSCSEDKTTELGWTNKSDAAINTIIWADGDAEWINGDTGYNPTTNPDTEQKEVSKLSGDVECSIFDGTNFVGAAVEVEGSASNSLTLNEGESQRLDIVASKKK